MSKNKQLKIALDAGHGYNTPGKRTPDDEREWYFNDIVLRACEKELRTYKNVSILRLDDSTGKTDVPLKTRTKKANDWKADLLVSIHHNAYLSKWGDWGGVETYVYKRNSVAEKIANLVNPKIVKAMGLRNRGVLTKNLHMIRESHMPAILTEGGFMDSLTDIKSLRDKQKLNNQGIGIATGIAEYYKLTKINGEKNKGELTMSQYNELKKEIENLKNVKLKGTQKKDMFNLLKFAYDSNIFTVDHSQNIDKLTKDEALDLLISFNGRYHLKK